MYGPILKKKISDIKSTETIFILLLFFFSNARNFDLILNNYQIFSTHILILHV